MHAYHSIFLSGMQRLTDQTLGSHRHTHCSQKSFHKIHIVLFISICRCSGWLKHKAKCGAVGATSNYSVMKQACYLQTVTMETKTSCGSASMEQSSEDKKWGECQWTKACKDTSRHAGAVRPCSWLAATCSALHNAYSSAQAAFLCHTHLHMHYTYKWYTHYIYTRICIYIFLYMYIFYT